MTSIIILTYNGLDETTAPCLESLFRHTQGENWEVIVVDNGSTDGTRDYLAGLAAKEPRLRCLFNKTNRGFAGGNNDGIRVAKGDVFVLLNNDTQVGEGWLQKLSDPLLAEPSVGLLGPVTNAVGNEQKIDTTAATPSGILDEGAQWIRLCEGDSFETSRLGFFCVAVRRDTVERVGPLDEDFDLGFFEDDDYCIRIAQAGYRMVCRDDAFVYHCGSASFKKNPELTRQLLKKNRRLLESKHGVSWHPRHQRDRLLDLVESHLQQSGDPGFRNRMQLKAANRLRAAENLAPRGVVKRLIFHLRLRKIRRKMRIMNG